MPKPDDNTFDLDLNHSYLNYRRMKIVGTIGPASQDPATLRKLINAGLNVARINFSHGNPADHVKVMETIRKAASDTGKSVAILADLCGPKIRVGNFKNDFIVLKQNSIVTITVSAVTGDEGLIPSQYRLLAKEVKIGDPILLDDGNMELHVTKTVDAKTIRAKVIRGGILKNHKGMNLPQTRMKISALTKKDKSDIRYAIEGKADFIALSFVRSPGDITELRNILKKLNANIPIIAKIEKPEALECILKITELADGIMVARGDLGVELPAKKVPIIQNKLIQIANQANKPVIVATQMLESMITNSRPTRAEVTDVAGACSAGADAVMLSAETAVGKYPVESVKMMDSILRETEAYQFFSQKGKFTKAGLDINNELHEALGTSIAQLSRDLMVRAVFVLTRSGYSARIISGDRPAAPIMALVHSEVLQRQMNLLWGVYPHSITKDFDIKKIPSFCEGLIKKQKLARKGDYILLLAGLTEMNVATNSLMVHRLS